MFFPRFPPGISAAFWLAAALILLVELAMHSDQVVHQYRAVFAAGRAMDKVIQIEKQPPKILFIGNSRVDNGIDPKTVVHAMSLNRDAGFNLGVPGANLLIYHGMLSRLAQKGLLGEAGIATVVIGLDESAMQADDSLGYTAFLADRWALLDGKQYKAWLETWIRLWAYSGNLRQLHEPEKLIRFIQASVSEVEPVGGGASQYLGYRAGFEGGQNKAQIQRQEAGTRQPPDDNVLPYLWRTVDLLKQYDVNIYIAFLPLLNRKTLYLDNDLPEAQPYRDVLASLNAREVKIIEPELEQFTSEDFVNAGHLNNRGAQRFSAALGRQLSKVTAY